MYFTCAANYAFYVCENLFSALHFWPHPQRFLMSTLHHKVFRSRYCRESLNEAVCCYLKKAYEDTGHVKFLKDEARRTK